MILIVIKNKQLTCVDLIRRQSRAPANSVSIGCLEIVLQLPVKTAAN